MYNVFAQIWGLLISCEGGDCVGLATIFVKLLDICSWIFTSKICSEQPQSLEDSLFIYEIVCFLL